MELDRIIITGARQHNLKNVTVDDPEEEAGDPHRRLGLGQVVARLRHALRRGPAPLHREPERLRPPVPRPDGQAALRLDPRPRPHHLDRAEGRAAATRARPWARSRRSTTTCACSGRASARLTCHNCGRPVSQQSSQQIVHEMLRLAAGHEVPPPGAAREGAQGRAPRRRSSRCARPASPACGSTASCSPSRTTIRLDKKKKHTIDAVVDRLIAKPGMAPARSPTRSRPRCATARARRRSPPRASTEQVLSRAPGLPPLRHLVPRALARSSSPSTRPRACAPSAPASARAWRWTRSSSSRTRASRSTRAR